MNEKSKKLDKILKELGSFAVAFSGGVDSSFLLQRAKKVLNNSVTSITVRTTYVPQIELAEAIEFAKELGVTHKIIEVEFPEIIRNNPIDRCYLCKKKLFSEIISYAKSNGYRYIVDGTNADDAGDFRPGMKALEEMNVRSPLLEAGFTKSDIREHLKAEGLTIWEKPAMACLLTRIPYNTNVTDDMLRMVEKAEILFFESGYPGTRVRIHGDIARIECLPGFMEKIVEKNERDNLVSGLKKLGFRYISLDLEGYRTGSLNPENEHK